MKDKKEAPAAPAPSKGSRESRTAANKKRREAQLAKALKNGRKARRDPGLAGSAPEDWSHRRKAERAKTRYFKQLHAAATLPPCSGAKAPEPKPYTRSASVEVRELLAVGRG